MTTFTRYWESYLATDGCYYLRFMLGPNRIQEHPMRWGDGEVEVWWEGKALEHFSTYQSFYQAMTRRMSELNQAIYERTMGRG